MSKTPDVPDASGTPTGRKGGPKQDTPKHGQEKPLRDPEPDHEPTKPEEI